jgi:hypothetical protein
MGMSNETATTQDREWQVLHEKITETLDRFGTKNPFGKGDYWLVDDNWGWCRQQLEFQNLNLFRPQVIKSLQALLAKFPKWEITVRANAVGKENWPGMGLIIYNDEIIDELQREYFPPEFRNFFYEGARPWKKDRPNESFLLRRAIK